MKSFHPLSRHVFTYSEAILKKMDDENMQFEKTRLLIARPSKSAQPLTSYGGPNCDFFFRIITGCAKLSGLAQEIYFFSMV